MAIWNDPTLSKTQSINSLDITKASIELGFLQISLNSDCFTAGESISGTVFLQLEKPAISSVMYLILKGKEETHWIERVVEYSSGSISDKGKHLKKTRFRRKLKHISGQRYITCTRFSAVTFENSIVSAGQYTFEFKLYLPEILPNSLHITDGCTSARIYYKLKAELPLSDGSRLVNSLQVCIKPAHKEPIYDEIIEKECYMRSWLCISKGFCILKLHLPKNVYHSDETIALDIEIDNLQGKKLIRELYITILRTLLLFNDTHKNFCLTEKIFTHKLSIMVRPGTARTRENALHIPINLSTISDKILNLPSHRSELISCSYILQVGIQQNTLLKPKDHRIDQHIVIERHKGSLGTGPPTPTNWNPMIQGKSELLWESGLNFLPKKPKMPGEYDM